MTTQDKNAAIALWMGMKLSKSLNGISIYSDSVYPKSGGGYTQYYGKDTLKYHSDWNWLMGATIMCFNRYDEVTDSSVFSADNQQFKLNDALLETNIESLHEAVYQFVVWHNQQVNQNPKP